MYQDGSRDRQLVLVSRNLSRAVYPSRITNVRNIAMPIAPANTDSVAAFCGLRQIQHRARLNEEATEVAWDCVARGWRCWERRLDDV